MFDHHSTLGRIGGRALIVLSALLGTSACTALLSSTSGDQCSTNGDCEARGFAGYTCNAGLCVDERSPDDARLVSVQSELTCSTDDECIAANNGHAARCPTAGGKCQYIGNEYCSVTGDYKSRDAVFLGMMTQDTHPDGAVASISQAFSRLILFAHDESTKTLANGGIPGGVNGARRPLVMVSCEAGALQQERVDAIADRLLGTVGAPVVFTFHAGPGGAFWSSAVKQQKKTLMMSHMLNDARQYLTATGDTSLILNGFFPSEAAGTADAMRLTQLESTIRAEPGFAGPNVRFAQLVKQDVQANVFTSVAKAHTDALELNGAAASTQLGTNYQVIPYETSVPGSLSSAIAQTVAMSPHAIMMSGDLEMQRVVMTMVEALWPSGQPRPYYAGVNQQLLETHETVGSNENLRSRFFGAVAAPPQPDAATYQAKLGEVQAKYPGFPTYQPSFAYDSFYTILYAIVAAGNVPNGQPTPEDILNGIKKLQVGAKVRAGSAGLIAGVDALYQTGSIEFQGIAGRQYNWDLSKGATPINNAIFFCVRRLPNGLPLVSFPSAPTYTGLIYNVPGNSLIGDYTCQ